MIIDIVKVFLPAVVAFVLGVLLTPILTNYLYKNKMWKQKPGKIALDGSAAAIRNELHKDRDVGTPSMGGIVIWASAAATIVGIWLVSQFFPTETILKLDFLSRNQTWIPLGTLLLGALVGLVDDFLEIKRSQEGKNGGLSIYKRLFVVGLVALFCAWWFYEKLDVVSIGLPAIWGELPVGIFLIPIFVLVTLAIYAGGVIDGLDGLAGGVFTTMFAAYGGIAFYQQQIDLAA